MNLPLAAPGNRRAVADEIRHRSTALAERVQFRLLPGAPDPSDPVWTGLLEHIEALAAAIEIGSFAAFAEHMRWSQRVMKSRADRGLRLDQALGHLADALESLSPESARLARPIIDECIRSCFDRDEAHQAGHAASMITWQGRNKFLKAILEGDRRTALHVCLDAVARRLPLDQIYEEIIMDALYELGRKWERNQISIADEQLAALVAQSTIAEIFLKIPLPPENPQGVLVASVEGERHSIGLQMVADILLEAGWRVRLLGCDIPVADLLRSVRRHEPDVVCLSATSLPSLAKSGRYVAALNQEFGAGSPAVLLGGQAIHLAPEYARECGADEIAFTLSECREAVARLMQGNPMRHAASNRVQ